MTGPGEGGSSSGYTSTQLDDEVSMKRNQSQSMQPAQAGARSKCVTVPKETSRILKASVSCNPWLRESKKEKGGSKSIEILFWSVSRSQSPRTASGPQQAL